MGLFSVGSAQPKDASEMEKFMKLASSNGVEVLCFPEGFLGKESVDEALKLAKDYGIWVVTGYDEMEETKEKYQSAIIINGQGEIIGKHRKTYLSNSEIEDGRAAGEKKEIYRTEFGIFGIVICAEILLPEITRVLTLKGAEVVFHPIGSGMDSQLQYDGWKGMVRTRAMENLLYFVTSTHFTASRRAKNKTPLPLGLIVNPGGTVLAETRKNDLICASIDLRNRNEDARKGEGPSPGSHSKMISRRQPKLYSLIART